MRRLVWAMWVPRETFAWPPELQVRMCGPLVSEEQSLSCLSSQSFALVLGDSQVLSMWTLDA